MATEELPARVILHVEDNDADALFLGRAANEVGGLPPLRRVADGAQAIDYLAGTGAFSNREEHPFPTLVLLDLKLPKKSGLEVLEWARDQGIRMPCVIVLTSSSEPADVRRAYELGADAYVEKPVSMGLLRRIVAELSTLCKDPTLSVQAVMSWYIKPLA